MSIKLVCATSVVMYICNMPQALAQAGSSPDKMIYQCSWSKDSNTTSADTSNPPSFCYSDAKTAAEAKVDCSNWVKPLGSKLQILTGSNPVQIHIDQCVCISPACGFKPATSTDESSLSHSTAVVPIPVAPPMPTPTPDLGSTQSDVVNTSNTVTSSSTLSNQVQAYSAPKKNKRAKKSRRSSLRIKQKTKIKG